VQTRLLALVAIAVLFAGCNGGTVDRHALTNDAATIDSMACEGALLAHSIAHGKTTTFYAREQAEELEIQASNLADALAERHTLAAIEQRVRAKARVASQLSAILQRLHDHPSDRDAAATIEAQLKRVGGCT
jgi:hypothetical protein